MSKSTASACQLHAYSYRRWRPRQTILLIQYTIQVYETRDAVLNDNSKCFKVNCIGVPASCIQLMPMETVPTQFNIQYTRQVYETKHGVLNDNSKCFKVDAIGVPASCIQLPPMETAPNYITYTVHNTSIRDKGCCTQ